MKAELVERLAVISWRLRRVPVFEAAILATRQAHVLNLWGEFCPRRDVPRRRAGTQHRRNVSIFDGSYHDALGKMSRHEMSLMKAFTKTLEALIILRDNRSDNNVVTLETVALPPAEE